MKLSTNLILIFFIIGPVSQATIIERLMAPFSWLIRRGFVRNTTQIDNSTEIIDLITDLPTTTVSSFLNESTVKSEITELVTEINDTKISFESSYSLNDSKVDETTPKMSTTLKTDEIIDTVISYNDEIVAQSSTSTTESSTISEPVIIKEKLLEEITTTPASTARPIPTTLRTITLITDPSTVQPIYKVLQTQKTFTPTTESITEPATPTLTESIPTSTQITTTSTESTTTPATTTTKPFFNVRQPRKPENLIKTKIIITLPPPTTESMPTTTISPIKLEAFDKSVSPPLTLVDFLANLTSSIEKSVRQGRTEDAIEAIPMPIYIPEKKKSEAEIIYRPQFLYHSELANALNGHYFIQPNN